MQALTSLILVALGISAITVFLYEYDKKFLLGKKISYWKRQLLFGLIFGIFAVCGTEFGFQINGAVMNVRDAAPLCAGLFFGPEAGVIAGLIGGIERWFAVYWGAGEYTRVACTVGTIVSGLLGAFIKKYMFEGKLPGPFYSLAIGAIAEIFHMLALYATNMDTAQQAHTVLLTCGPVMIPLVAIATALPSFVISVLEGVQFKWESRERDIAQNIAIGILIAVVVAFVITNAFQIRFQDNLARQNAEFAITQELDDVKHLTEIAMWRGEDERAFLQNELTHRHIGQIGYLVAVNQDGYAVAFTEGALTPEQRDMSDAMDVIRSNEDGDIQRITYEGIDYYGAHVTCGDYYIIGMYPTIEAEFSKSVSVVISAFLEIVVLTIVFLMIYILIRQTVVNNLRKINKDLAAITSGQLDTVVDVTTCTEFASLSDDINQTVNALKGYIAQAAAKVEEELAVAKNIQRSALPTLYPEDNRYELYANMLAAKEVGGDFYDFYDVDENRVAFLIADVSGKGIPAAMFMMTAKSTIKGFVQQGASPAVAFTKANERLCQDNAAEMFVTAWMGIMDVNTGHVVYANAGHNPPVIKQADGTIEFLKCRPGFVLAGMEGIQYKDFELDLAEGQSLLLYTDGVTEATDVNNKLFGEDRLIAAVEESGNLNMRYTCKLVKQRVDEFVGEAPQFDDITMLGIKRKTDEDRLGYLVLETTPESADQVREFFDIFCEHYDVSFKAATKIMVMVDEIYSNILNYSGATYAIVTAEYGDGKVIMSYQDNGIAYDPLAKEDPDITLSAAERKIGGLGIYMVKKMAEDVKYARIGDKNVLDVVLQV